MRQIFVFSVHDQPHRQPKFNRHESQKRFSVDPEISVGHIRHINIRHRVEMPIAEMVYRVLYEGASVRKEMRELTTKLI